MNKARLETFSDSVIAVIITIMVLDMKAPSGVTLASLKPLLPIFISYLLSFVFIGIYWNNHHHLLQATQKVNGKILWANLHLLFWLSLIPFLTTWIGENYSAPWPTALYGVGLLGASLAYQILTLVLISFHGKGSPLAKAHKHGIKEILSILLFMIAIPLAFKQPFFAYALYIIVAVMWFIPDRRIEHSLDMNRQ
jgi:uncharacterized membrane protein